MKKIIEMSKNNDYTTDVIGKIQEDYWETMLFIIEKLEETTFNFSQNSVSIIQNGNTKDYKFVK